MNRVQTISLDKGTLAFTLLAVALITLTPRIPILWDIFDPWLFLVFDGNWKRVDIFYYSVVAIALLQLARRTLPLGDWPWPVILGGGPFAVWTLLSCSWSRFPEFSLHEWFRGNLLPLAALAIGFACIRTAAVSRRVIEAGGLIICFYLPAGYLVLSGMLHVIGFDVVVTSTWLAYCFPLLVWQVADGCDEVTPKATYLPMLILLYCQALVLMLFPQRMYMLALFAVLLATLLAYFLSAVNPREKRFWYSYTIVIMVFLVAAYYSISLIRPISYLDASIGMEGSSYKVFFYSERYQIFKYWLIHGVEHLWAGVGLGWQLPAMEYNHRFLEDTAVNDLTYSHGHNYLINIWLQTGLIGLLAFAGWLLVVLRHAMKDYGALTVRGKRMVICLLGLVAVMLLRNMSDDGMREGNPVFFWLLVGGALGYIERLRMSSRRFQSA